MRKSQKIIYGIAKFFLRLARFLFSHVTLACWCCGDLVGMQSVFSRNKMWCWACYERYVDNAQQSIHADAAPIDAVGDNQND